MILSVNSKNLATWGLWAAFLCCLAWGAACDESKPVDPKTDTPDEAILPELDDEPETDLAEIEVYDPFGDSDNDGLPDYLEDLNGNGIFEPELGETDPFNPDTDNDGLKDGTEDANQNGFFDPGETDPLNPDTDGDGLKDGIEDANRNGIHDPQLGETDPRLADTDGDGIDDKTEVESEIGLDPNNPDTDYDWIPDGIEDANHNGIFEPELGETNPVSADTDGDRLSDGCEDRNLNGRLDPGETDPRRPDTDGDGLKDGDECQVLPAGACPDFDNEGNCATNPTLFDTDGDGLSDFVEFTSDYGGGVSSDPRNPDTDGDTVPDGLEDFNHNGRYEPHLGETNPIDPMSDGMVPDGQRPQAQACVNPVFPAQIVGPNVDLRFAHDHRFTAAELGFGANPPPMLAAWALDSANPAVVGFVISKRPGTGVTSALEQEGIDAASIGGNLTFPRAFTSWDGHDARISTYEFSATGNTVSVRNSVISKLTGLPTSAISGLPTTGGQNAGSYELALYTVFRDASQVILVGAILPHDSTPSDQAVVLASTLSNGTGVARFADHFGTTNTGEPLKACNIFRVTELPIVDFLFIIDDTASMGPYQEALRQSTTEIFSAVRGAFVSARWTIGSTEVGTTGTYDGSTSHCGILSQPQGPGGMAWAPFTSDYEEGFKCRVRDPLGIQNCDPTGNTFTGWAEYGLLCSKWAIDYFQGRRGTLNPVDLQRPRSELIVIVVTDENEDIASEQGSEMSAIDKAETLQWLGVSSWSQVNAQLAANRFVDFFHNTASSPPYGDATPFLVYNRRSSYERAVYWEFMDLNPNNFPNGASMDINEVAQIPGFVQKVIRAATGMASSFTPMHVPITVEMKVVVQRAFSVESMALQHSNTNGWGYDPVANSMVFFGEDRPRILDSFAISYPYWVAGAPD